MILGVSVFGRAEVCRLRCPGHYWLVGWMTVKPLRDGTGLLVGTADRVDLWQQRLGVGQVGQIPAFMLAGRTEPGELTRKLILVFQVVKQAVAQFAISGWRQMRAMGQIMADFTKNPGSALSCATNHDCVGVCVL